MGNTVLTVNIPSEETLLYIRFVALHHNITTRSPGTSATGLQQLVLQYT